MTDNNRLQLAQRIFDLVYDKCESFREQNIGADLAHLLGAIIDRVEETSYVDWSSAYGPPYALLKILQDNLPSDDPVWQFIHLDTEENELRVGELSVEGRAVGDPCFSLSTLNSDTLNLLDHLHFADSRDIDGGLYVCNEHDRIVLDLSEPDAATQLLSVDERIALGKLLAHAPDFQRSHASLLVSCQKLVEWLCAIREKNCAMVTETAPGSFSLTEAQGDLAAAQELIRSAKS